ncbi:MAG: hypothetical protein R3336_01105, partial [Phycisphaeraceae bacterium]|nr:hypothetical protein [Phycisphaeraceae bacterium]
MSKTSPPISGPTPVIFDPERREQLRRGPSGRRMKNRIFLAICIATASLSVLVLAVLLAAIAWAGFSGLDWEFMTSPPDTDPESAGIYPSLWGTIWVCGVCALSSLPLGVAAAIFIEEFQPRKTWLRRIHSFIQLNISNLAGVPSVVYGIIGLTAFAHMFGLFGSPKDPFLEWGVTWYDQYFNEAWQVVMVPADQGQGDKVELKSGMTALKMIEPEVPEGVDPASVKPEAVPVKLNVVGAEEPFPEDPELAARSVRETSEPGRISLKNWYYFRLPFGRGVLTGGLTL